MTRWTAAVLGAAGHTGRFVVAELARRGAGAILVGRDAARLEAAAATAPAGAVRGVRAASFDDPAALDRALAGADVVLHCAGPFLDTAAPVIEAALRARISYLDVTAEQPSAQGTLERYADAAREAGVAVVPAMAFYGGLADLLATAAMGAWEAADSIETAVALDSWRPTTGTRVTGQRNTATRVVVSGGVLRPLPAPAPTRAWELPAPWGAQELVELPLSEIVLIARHLRAPEVHSYMNPAPLADLRRDDPSGPVATDEHGRSSQQFAVEVVVRRGAESRRVRARGQDIYAVTGPLLVEAAQRIVEGRTRPAFRAGAAAPGELFDAADFLRALSPDPLSLEGIE